jgi:hypothetical protein
MMTRRVALLAGFGPFAAAPYAALAGEFWNDKEPSVWSDKDVERMLTRSPWAKDATVQMNFSAMQQGGAPGGGMGRGGPGRGGPGMGGPGMGGPGMGGGPMGGPPGEGSGGGGPTQFKAIVRWESAAPIRAARKKEGEEQDAAFYVISVSGLPAMRSGRRPPGSTAAPPEADKEMQERMKQATSLQPKGRIAISPARIENSGDGVILFFFTREAIPLSLDDKEVAFATHLGPLEVKAKFVLKEMRYCGKLAV